MRTVPKAETYTLGDIQEGIKMGLDQTEIAHIISVITDLYSDPILAVVREYSTNALDSHIEAGNPAPIKVTLPTTEKPNFVVEDFGLGLSLEEFKNVYALYGASTKRDSDEVNGTLGLGCKSALTYSPSFTVDARKNGRRVVASIAKGADGIGVINVIDENDTDLPNGVKVTIPVRPNDLSDFEYAADSLYPYWEQGTVTVDNVYPSPWYDSLNTDDVITIDEDVFVVKATADLDHSYVVMGNVPYKVDLSFAHKVVAYIPPGSVHFTPSREDLHRTRHTDETIDTLTEYVVDRFPNVLSDFISFAPTEWQRTARWLTWRRGLPRNIARRIRSLFLYAEESIVLPNERPAFHYEPSSYRRRKTEEANGSVRWDWVNRDEIHIITGCPVKTLTTHHRARLSRYKGDRDYTILPVGLDITFLDGRPNVSTWEEFIEQSAPPKTETVKRDKTTYKTLGTGGLEFLTAKELANSAEPILYFVHHVRDTDLRTLQNHRSIFPTHRHVQITLNQENKFQRLFPNAGNYNTYLGEARADALKALTDDDKLQYAVRHGYGFNLGWLSRHSERISDPDLRALLELASQDVSDAVKTALRVGVGLNSNAYAAAFQKWDQRYPLASRNQPEDSILYINAKWIAENHKKVLTQQQRGATVPSTQQEKKAS